MEHICVFEQITVSFRIVLSGKRLSVDYWTVDALSSYNVLSDNTSKSVERNDNLNFVCNGERFDCLIINNTIPEICIMEQQYMYMYK